LTASLLFVRIIDEWEIVVKKDENSKKVVKFSGIYTNTLDEKGRISIPADLRECLEAPVLILTKGLEHCVWVLPPDYWEKLSGKFLSPQSLDMEEASLVHYRFIVPMQKAELDKTGRIAVPQSLRDYAGLSRECSILGKGDYMELWNAEAFKDFEASNEMNVRNAIKKLGAL
jgi:MraZ protein